MAFRNRQIKTKRQFSNNKSRMLKRRRKGKGRRGRGKRSSFMHYVETIPISIELNKSATLTVKNLANRPKLSNFRIQYVHFVGLAAYDESSTNSTGYMAPSCLQLSLVDGDDGAFSATSGPVVLGVMPRNVKVHTPRQMDWMPYNISDSTKIAYLEAVCIGKASSDTNRHQYVRGIVHVLVRFGPEMTAGNCSTSLRSIFDTTLVQSVEVKESAESPSGLSDEFENL